MPHTTRCAWVKDEWDAAYHDNEWGRPQHDDDKLFELLILEGMQAGLSWNLILRRREGMRAAFDGFDPRILATYDEDRVAQLMQNPAVIRNRLKLRALAKNAIAFLAVQRECGSFDEYIWQFVGGVPVQNAWAPGQPTPATSPQGDAMSRALKKRGFTFVGPTICYSFMQAAGMVNDHSTDCAHHALCAAAGGAPIP